MNIGNIGWLIVERLVWASLSLSVGYAAAALVSRLAFVPPSAKAWTWRLVVLQASLIVVFNVSFGIQVLDNSGPQQAGNPNAVWAAAGAGLGMFWLAAACALLFGLLRSAWQTRQMLMELTSMPRPLTADAGAASYRLMRELSCPVVALCPRPIIAAPEWCWHDTAQARLALAHEAAHLRRWDVLWQVFGSGCAALFWFHPLGQKAVKELSFWQECAADAAAIRTIDCEHHDYATAIVDIVAGVREPQIPLAVGLGMQARQLGRRLEVAVDGGRSRPWLGAFVALLIIGPALVPWRAAAAAREEAGAVAVPVAAPEGSVGSVVLDPRVAAPMMAGGG